MAAHTLMGRQRRLLTHVDLSLAMFRGEIADSSSKADRLAFAQECLAEAVAIQAKLDKRAAKAAA